MGPAVKIFWDKWVRDTVYCDVCEMLTSDLNRHLRTARRKRNLNADLSKLKKHRSGADRNRQLRLLRDTSPRDAIASTPAQGDDLRKGMKSW